MCFIFIVIKQCRYYLLTGYHSENTIPEEIISEVPPIPTELVTQPSAIISASPTVLPTTVEGGKGKEEEEIVTDVPETRVFPGNTSPPVPETAEPQDPPSAATKSAEKISEKKEAIGKTDLKSSSGR